MLSKPSSATLVGAGLLIVYDFFAYRSGRATFYRRWAVPLRSAVYAVFVFVTVMGLAESAQRLHLLPVSDRVSTTPRCDVFDKPWTCADLVCVLVGRRPTSRSARGCDWLAQAFSRFGSGALISTTAARSRASLDRMVAEPTRQHRRADPRGRLARSGRNGGVLPTKPGPTWYRSAGQHLRPVFRQQRRPRSRSKRDGHITIALVSARRPLPPITRMPPPRLDPRFPRCRCDRVRHPRLVGRADRCDVGVPASASKHPAPFTYPHYSLDGGTLQALMPAFTTEQGFRTALEARSTVWQTFKRELAAHDRGYDPLVFDRTPLDASQLVLLMRRGLGRAAAGLQPRCLRRRPRLQPRFAADHHRQGDARIARKTRPCPRQTPDRVCSNKTAATAIRSSGHSARPCARPAIDYNQHRQIVLVAGSEQLHRRRSLHRPRERVVGGMRCAR